MESNGLWLLGRRRFLCRVAPGALSRSSLLASPPSPVGSIQRATQGAKSDLIAAFPDGRPTARPPVAVGAQSDTVGRTAVRMRTHACKDQAMTTSSLYYGHRQFQILAYHDAIRHDGSALELAELVDGELGPALMTVLFSSDDPAEAAEVLLTECTLPQSILAAFMEEAAS